MRENIRSQSGNLDRSGRAMLWVFGGLSVAGVLVASWALSPRHAWSSCIPQSESARSEARELRYAVLVRALAAPRRCPTVNDLVRDRVIDRASSVTDPWGRPWRIVCQADDVIVSSAGPDGIEGTRDDVVAANPSR
jgi:hypothetical protein